MFFHLQALFSGLCTPLHCIVLALLTECDCYTTHLNIILCLWTGTVVCVCFLSYSVGFLYPGTGFCTHPWQNPPCLCRWGDPAFPEAAPFHCRSVKIQTFYVIFLKKTATAFEAIMKTIYGKRKWKTRRENKECLDFPIHSRYKHHNSCRLT